MPSDRGKKGSEMDDQGLEKEIDRMTSDCQIWQMPALSKPEQELPIVRGTTLYQSAACRQAYVLFDRMVCKILEAYGHITDPYPDAFKKRFRDEAVALRKQINECGHRQILAQHPGYRKMLGFLDIEPEQAYRILENAIRERNGQ